MIISWQIQDSHSQLDSSNLISLWEYKNVLDNVECDKPLEIYTLLFFSSFFIPFSKLILISKGICKSFYNILLSLSYSLYNNNFTLFI